MRWLRSFARLDLWFEACACFSIVLCVSTNHVRASVELTATRDDPFEGVWLGKVTAPNESVDIGFAFTRSDAGLGATFYMPEMFVYGMGLGPADVHDGTYTFQPLDTTLKISGDTLTGTFGTSKLPVELHRGGAFAPEPKPRELPAAPKCVWSQSLGAEVWASPVVAAGIVYVGSTDGVMHAVRAKDGEQAWTWKGPHPLFGQALVEDGAVYFVDDACVLTSLECKDGHLRWSTPLYDETLAAPPTSQDETFNHRTPVPVLAEGVVYVGSTDNGIYAIENVFGKTLWRHDAKARIYAGVLLGASHGLIAGCYDGTVLKLDRLTHKETARVKLPGPVVSTPVVAGDRIVIGCRDYMLYGLEPRNLAISWRNGYWFSWVESTPRVVDGTLYIGGSDYRRISALEPATGKRVWATDVRGLTWGTPVVTADTVFAGTSSQKGAVIEHDGGLMALDRKTGAVKWWARVPEAKGSNRSGYIGSLALTDGLVIGAGVDGTLVAYPAH